MIKLKFSSFLLLSNSFDFFSIFWGYLCRADLFLWGLGGHLYDLYHVSVFHHIVGLPILGANFWYPGIRIFCFHWLFLSHQTFLHFFLFLKGSIRDIPYFAPNDALYFFFTLWNHPVGSGGEVSSNNFLANETAFDIFILGIMIKLFLHIVRFFKLFNYLGLRISQISFFLVPALLSRDLFQVIDLLIKLRMFEIVDNGPAFI